MEYRGPVKDSNLSAARLAQIGAHVVKKAEAKAAGAEQAASKDVEPAKQTWKPRRSYIDIGGGAEEAAPKPAPTHRMTPCDNLPAAAPAAGHGDDDEGRSYLDAPRDALPQDPELRSSRWFLADELNTMRHVSRTKQMGYDDKDFQGKPIIAIINTCAASPMSSLRLDLIRRRWRTAGATCCRATRTSRSAWRR